MYPKPIADLSGWMVRSVGCSGKGWMVAADDSVIGCAPSPCFGELVSLKFVNNKRYTNEFTQKMAVMF